MVAITYPNKKLLTTGSYVNPMVEAFEQDMTGELAHEWKVLGIFPRRGNNDSTGAATEMPKGVGNRYSWECFVLFKSEDGEDTAESLGLNLAQKFTQFAKDSPKVCVHLVIANVISRTIMTNVSTHGIDCSLNMKYAKEMPFVFRKADNKDDEKKSLDYYLLDSDVVSIMKRMYSDSTKEAVASDPDITKTFFTSFIKANEVLSKYTEAHWQSL